MTDRPVGASSAPVSERTNPADAIQARWAWVAPEVWTDRMLTALEQGVRGGRWDTPRIKWRRCRRYGRPSHG